MTHRTLRHPAAFVAAVLLGFGMLVDAQQTQQAATPTAQDIKLPLRGGSTRFLVLGDTGTGGSGQFEIGKKAEQYRQKVNFDFALMLGDNIYGSERPQDFLKKFELPYKPLLDAGVKFYAALGNHDTPNQRNYKLFNMGGKQYYTFRPKLGVRFFALDSNYMSPEQLTWLENELKASGSDWKIAFFHHPLYSSGGRHGSDAALRDQLEPLFIKYSVDVVLSGHDHFYERLKPQKGIAYFVVGGSAKLRSGDIGTTGLTAKGFDTGYSFMAVEIAGDEFHFQTISDQGKTVDSGVVKRRAAPATK